MGSRIEILRQSEELVHNCELQHREIFYTDRDRILRSNTLPELASALLLWGGNSLKLATEQVRISAITLLALIRNEEIEIDSHDTRK